MLTRQLSTRAELLSENTLTYKNKWGAHELEGLLGFTAQKSFYRYNQIVATNFPDEMILSLNLASQLVLDSPSIPGTTSFYYNNALASFLSRLNYAYQGKYLASVSMRADGSSLFAAGKKWDYFPSVSLGWRPSEEAILKELEWLSNLKARVSFGVTGNNAIPQYAYMNQINTNNYVLGSGNGNLVQGMASNSAALGNPDITWEQVEEFNFGLDLGFFNSKIIYLLSIIIQIQYDYFYNNLPCLLPDTRLIGIILVKLITRVGKLSYLQQILHDVISHGKPQQTFRQIKIPCFIMVTKNVKTILENVTKYIVQLSGNLLFSILDTNPMVYGQLLKK